MSNEPMPDGSPRSGLSQAVVGEIVRERADALAEVERLRETLHRIATDPLCKANAPSIAAEARAVLR